MPEKIPPSPQDKDAFTSTTPEGARCRSLIDLSKAIGGLFPLEFEQAAEQETKIKSLLADLFKREVTPEEEKVALNGLLEIIQSLSDKFITTREAITTALSLLEEPSSEDS